VWDPYSEFQSATLPNGLTVHAAHWQGRPWEYVGFVIHTGAEHDPAGLEGLAHYVEHLVSLNAATPREEIEALFKNCGGAASLGKTFYSCVEYYFFVPTDKATLSKALSMFGEMLLLANLEKFIERERKVISAEFFQHFPTKHKVDLIQRERRVLYSGWWLERLVGAIGHPESIARITQRDLQSHYDKHYTPANISIAGVGGLALSELVALISESPFGIAKKGIRTSPPNPESEVTPPSENQCVFELSQYLSTPIPSELGACSYRSVAKIPGTINTRAIHLLGNMLDEVLADEVREHRAWAYAINTVRTNYRYFYQFTIKCDWFPPEALDKIEEVVEACITSVGDREDLFEQLKRRALASYSMIDAKGKEICLGAMDNLAVHQRIISLAEDRSETERVMMSDIRNLLQYLRPECRWTLITRP